MPTLIKNKKIYLNYEILDNFDAGLELYGFEVKSIRNKQGSLEGSYVRVRGGEVFLVGANIPPYQQANTPKDYDAYRVRKLLITKKEITQITTAEKTRGLTLVPISIHTKGRNIKLYFGVARGKKKYDKREDLKKKDSRRDVEREMKG